MFKRGLDVSTALDVGLPRYIKDYLTIGDNVELYTVQELLDLNLAKEDAGIEWDGENIRFRPAVKIDPNRKFSTIIIQSWQGFGKTVRVREFAGNLIYTDLDSVMIPFSMIKKVL